MPPRSLTRHVRLLFLSASLAVAAVALGGMNRLQAADITVDTFDDELNTDGDCSLREAVDAANTDAAVDACPKGDGQDRVLLAAGLWTLGATLEFTATQASGGPALQPAVSLVGAGAERTVLRGNGQTRLIHVAQNAAVEIVGLTLADGHAPDGSSYVDSGEEEPPPVGNGENGGAILNEGILQVRQCTIRDSRAGNGGDSIASFYAGPSPGGAGKGGGIFNEGILLISQCTIRDSRAGNGGSSSAEWSDHQPGSAGTGGGIYNAGMLTITQSAILSNTAGVSGDVGYRYYYQAPSGGEGGGIFNAGIMHLQNSTVSHNSTPDGGGGVSYESGSSAPGSGGSGGGMFNRGVATLDNVTLVANRAGRGGIIIEKDLISESVSITRYGSSGFGGGLRTIDENAALTLTNTILAYNQGSGKDCGGAIRSRGFNLIQAATSCTITDASADDQIGVDPLLFPLGMAGGATPVHRPGYLSPVLDRGSCLDSHGNTVTVDQHETARPIAGTCDIGAYEAAELPGLAYLPVIGRQ